MQTKEKLKEQQKILKKIVKAKLEDSDTSDSDE